MAKKKKDRSNKRYVPRDRNQLKLRHDPIRLRSVFDPLMSIVEQIEQDGTLTITGESQQPVFKETSSGQWYDTAGALIGFIELFELFEIRYSTVLPLDPLRLLHNKIIDGDMIEDEVTQAVRASASVLYNACMDLTLAQADELVSDYKLKEALNGNMMDE